MSRGSTGFQFCHLTIASLIAATLAGCSSDSSAPAPISAVGSSGGAPMSVQSASSQQNTTTHPPPVISESQNSSNPSLTESQQQKVPSATGSAPTSAGVAQTPVKLANGKIVYDRHYGNIPKGSYSGNTYTVQRGDTLFYIAWITGNDYRDLAQRNNIAAPYSLSAGQRLQIANGAGQPITGSNEISRADNLESGTTALKSPTETGIKEEITQPKLTYSESTGNQINPNSAASSSGLLPNRTAVVGSAAVPIAAPTQSTSSSSASIASWRWPVKGNIIDKFSAAEGGNKGIDVAGSRGQAIVATAPGRVVYAGNALRGYGNLIIIKHNDDYLSAYAHNDSMLVREQQEVSAGQKIATMGSTGTSSVRLHFEIRYKGKSVNPLRYLPQP